MAIIGTLAGVRILTELLSPSVYGELALGLTIVTLINQVALAPITNGASRFYAPAVEHGTLGDYLRALRHLISKATVIIFLFGAAAISTLVIFGYFKWITLAIGSLIFAILSGYNSVLSAIQNSARQRSVVALHRGVDSWLRYGVAAGLIFFLGATSSVTMMGYLFSGLLILFSQYHFFKSRITVQISSISEYSTDIRREIWSFSRPFAIWGIFTWVRLVSDRWALGFFTTTEQVGSYAVLFQLGYYPMTVMAGVVMQIISPIFFQKVGDASEEKRNKHIFDLSRNFVVLFLGGTGILFLFVNYFHAQIFEVFVAKEYSTYSYLLPWILLASGIYAASQILVVNLMCHMNTKVMLLPTITTAVLGSLLNFIMAYYFEITGLVVSQMLFSMVYIVWMVILSINEKNKYKTV